MDLLTPKRSTEDLVRSASVEKNLTKSELVRRCVELDNCRLTNTGAVVAYSGQFTGRIPKDKFIVADDKTRDEIWWEGNSPISPEHFDRIREKAVGYLADHKLYVVDALAGADESYQIKVRFVLERAYHALFISQLLIKPSEEQLKNFEPDWVVYDACRLHLDPATDGTRTHSAITLNFTTQEVIIAGTEYAGEIKKSIFTVMNYLLP
jgi:phosphoenolpyruvate carboxykinase (ATP)